MMCGSDGKVLDYWSDGGSETNCGHCCSVITGKMHEGFKYAVFFCVRPQWPVFYVS